MNNNDYLIAVSKQRALIRRLLASEKRRSDVLTKLVRERYAGLIGKFFNTGNEQWYNVPHSTICYINDVMSFAKNVFNDEVIVDLVCKVIVPREENGEMVNLNCHTQKFTFDYTVDLERMLADKLVDWQCADKWLHAMYEKMRRSYGLGYDRLTIALDKVESLEAALQIKNDEIARLKEDCL